MYECIVAKSRKNLSIFLFFLDYKFSPYKLAKIRATPKTNSPSRTCGPREMFSVAARSTFFFGGIMESGIDLFESYLKLNDV